MSRPGLLRTQALGGRKEISLRGKGRIRKEYSGVKSEGDRPPGWDWEEISGRNMSNRKGVGKVSGLKDVIPPPDFTNPQEGITHAY